MDVHHTYGEPFVKKLKIFLIAEKRSNEIGLSCKNPKMMLLKYCNGL